MKKRLNPLNDYILQKTLGEEGDEIQLLSLFNGIVARTDKRFSSIQILENKTLMADIMGYKQNVLDIRSIVDNTIRADIEVQLWDEKAMDRRSLHYWSNDFRYGIKRGESYKDLPDTIAINIVDFHHIDLDEYHTSFHIYEDRHKEYKLSDAFDLLRWTMGYKKRRRRLT
jgi:predicted transposase/invertase (TIGR01784 family)